MATQLYDQWEISRRLLAGQRSNGLIGIVQHSELFTAKVSFLNSWGAIALVQRSGQEGDTIQRDYTHICTERLHVERAYREHRPLGERARASAG